METMQTRNGVIADVAGGLVLCQPGQAELHQATDRLRLFCQTAFDGSMIVEYGIIREADATFAGLFGYAAEELCGRPITRFLSAAVPTLKLVPSDRSSSYEGVARRKDGSAFSVSIACTEIEPGQHIFAAREWSGRGGRDERENGSGDGDPVYSTHDLICVHDMMGRVLWASSGAARILEIPVHELQTLNVRDLLAPGAEKEFDAYLRILDRDGLAAGKMKVMTRDGRLRTWQYRTTIHIGANGARTARGVGRDVTEDERSIEAVRKNEEYYRSIIENASDVICVLDPIGVIRYHSPSMERSLELSPAQLTGSQLLDHVHPEDSPRIAEFIMRQSSGAADGTTIRVRLRGRSGSCRSFEMIAKNLMRDGTVDSIVINARDVTDREQLERQLEQATRVASLGRLAATVAHEFNNVLMGIQPFADLLRRPDRTPSMLEKCSTHIANSIQRGKRVAQDILRFTQPAKPVLTRLHLANWWRKLEPEIQAQVGNHISFTAQFPEDVEVLADSSQLAQVFSNLVSNARDAMPKAGRLAITVRLPGRNESFAFGTVIEPSAMVQISVADSGSGIPPAIIGHVFDPLFTTKESGGTGLGLAVAHQVITRHGGSIFVESELGTGTTFHLFLPRAAPGAASEPERAAPGTVRTRKVLIVDDEEGIVQGIADLLATEGIVSRAVITGGAAAAAVEEFEPELVLLDVGLPDLSGYEVARRLRAIHAQLPIIFTTGHGDRERIDVDPYSCFLQKPFDFDALLTAIAKLENIKDSNV